MSEGGVFRIVIDRERCTGHGRCYGASPDLFEPYDAEGRSSVLVESVSGDALDRARRTADGCPEAAIRLERVRTES